jgi:hypothetical protein
VRHRARRFPLKDVTQRLPSAACLGRRLAVSPSSPSPTGEPVLGSGKFCVVATKLVTYEVPYKALPPPGLPDPGLLVQDARVCPGA